MAPSKTLPPVSSNQTCKKCKNKLQTKDDLFIKCSGLCCLTYHTACVNVGKRNYNALTANTTNLKWLCDHCKVVMCDADGSLISSTITWNTKDALLLNKILTKINFLATTICEMKDELSTIRDSHGKCKTSVNLAHN